VLIETAPGDGVIALPGEKPILLSRYDQQENITIPGHLVIRPGETVRLGRDRSNELVLDIPNVSRFHALLAASSSSVRISDLSSTNGTLVNGTAISTPTKLETGDVIDVGPAKLKVELLNTLMTQTNLTMVGTQFDPITTTGIVTLLVADVCDYTKLTETLPSEDMAKMLQIWFEQVSQIIKKYDGKVDKYIGDCVMAFWHGSDTHARVFAVEAMKAAADIREITQRLSEGPQWPHRGLYPWRCRVSLNTGQVMMGRIGDRGSRDFTILGDVVNVAFRLISVAGDRGYDFVLGDGTAMHVRKRYPLTKLGPIAVKGRRQKVLAYTLA